MITLPTFIHVLGWFSLAINSIKVVGRRVSAPWACFARMPMLTRPEHHARQLFVVLTMATLACSPDVAYAADVATIVRVTVADGRVFSGEVDAKSNGDKLWLRSEKAGIALWRPIGWSSIRSVAAGEQVYGGMAFRDEYERWKTVARDQKSEVRGQKSGVRSEESAVDRPAGLADSSTSGFDSRYESLKPVIPPRVQSVSVSAQLANWDADVEPDGLIVYVAPLDADGNLVAIDGTIDAELIGEGPGTTDRQVTFPTLDRWVRSLRPADMGAQGARVRLEFQRAHPEFDLRLGPYGVVHVRLNVPGHGSFEATTDLTAVRTFNPIRDRVQQQSGQRFFPTERTGLGKRQTLQVNDR